MPDAPKPSLYAKLAQVMAENPRFWRKVDAQQAGCWLWKASLRRDGYGQIRVGDRTLRAHRVSYEALVGPIPTHLELDHLCRNRACVNPDHLEPVTHRENCRRGNVGLATPTQSHCRKGHELAGRNLYVAPDGERGCRTCRREAVYRHRANRRLEMESA